MQGCSSSAHRRLGTEGHDPLPGLTRLLLCCQMEAQGDMQPARLVLRLSLLCPGHRCPLPAPVWTQARDPRQELVASQTMHVLVPSWD